MIGDERTLISKETKEMYLTHTYRRLATKNGYGWKDEGKAKKRKT